MFAFLRSTQFDSIPVVTPDNFRHGEVGCAGYVMAKSVKLLREKMLGLQRNLLI